MITVYLMVDNVLQRCDITEQNSAQLKKAIWIDLLKPTIEEATLVESILAVDLPTREDMREIEVSSRLRKKGDILKMTASILANSESSQPILDAVSFILTKEKLVTIRYYDFQAFSLFVSRIQKNEIVDATAPLLLTRLLDTAIDRIADILERIGGAIETHSQAVFRHQDNAKNKLDYHKILKDIGANGDLCAKMRESLTTFNRAVSYFWQNQKEALGESGMLRINALSADMQALSDHVSFLSNQISFILNATLGMININQSNIIKIFSIAAVIFLPPTLVASTYGMNFTFMPHFLYSHFGFPIALGSMLLSAILPYQFFKWKKWL